MGEPAEGTLKLRVMVAAAIVLAVAGIVLGALWLLRPSSYQLKLATGSEGGTYLPLGKGMADVVKGAYDHIDIEVLPSSGAVDNIQRLQRGEVDLAFIQNDTTGSGKVRTVVPLYREVLHFIVRHDSGIETLRDIRGKRVSIGRKDSGTAALVYALLGHYDLDVAQFQAHYLG
ncbi:MAG: TAXI family TRAP transporter solute-binding subunit, partial [Deltaproteobacteria bacterium]|nr:TAXI family TRAP transporter solute-binding subunit [Deltaproteobacteria bacterium]